MDEEVVHIKDGFNMYSLCRKDLLKCLFDPYLFVDSYLPRRKVYPVFRTINLEETYPILEQVKIDKYPNFCKYCLSDFGLRLLCIY
jgi:hypothetical protein